MALVVAWAQRMLRSRKPAVILIALIVLLLIVIPLQLQQNVSTALRDKAIEFSHDVSWPAVPAFPGLPEFGHHNTGTPHKPPELHADPALTTRCQSAPPVLDSQGRRRPLVQYALMMDAGSTGSRIHIYKFNYCKDSPELEAEVFAHLKPGLSSFRGQPEKAAESLRPLLDKALEVVPEHLRRCTPVTLKATAGLRMVGAEHSHAILSAVRAMLESQYPFPIADSISASGVRLTDGVEIMDGRDEGVFAWITVNYLLNLIGKPNRKTRTAAVLDLGGGSTQIVFEPHINKQHMHPGEHVYELKGTFTTVCRLTLQTLAIRHSRCTKSHIWVTD